MPCGGEPNALKQLQVAVTRRGAGSRKAPHVSRECLVEQSGCVLARVPGAYAAADLLQDLEIGSHGSAMGQSGGLDRPLCAPPRHFPPLPKLALAYMT